MPFPAPAKKLKGSKKALIPKKANTIGRDKINKIKVSHGKALTIKSFTPTGRDGALSTKYVFKVSSKLFKLPTNLSMQINFGVVNTYVV